MTKLTPITGDDSLSRYAEIVALDVTPSYVINGDGHVLYCNAAAEAQCPAERFEASLRQHPQQAEALARAARTTAPQLTRWSTTAASGNSRNWRARLARLPARTKRVLLLVRLQPAVNPFPQLQNTTARRSAERRPQPRDPQVRQLLNSTLDGIGAVTEDGCITMANAAFAALLAGTNPIGAQLFDHLLLAPELADIPQPRDRLTALLGHPHEVELQLATGDPMPVELTVNRLDEPGGRQYIVVLRDLTTRCAFKEALARSQYLEAARDIARANEQNKTQFLATVSHEMRAPLGAISTASDLLLTEGGLSPDQRHMLELIHGSAETALDQINDTLEHVRMDLRPIKDHPLSSFAPCEVLQKLAAQSRISAEAKGLQLKLALECQTGLQVAGYHHLFHRVVQNLLSNAVKYTDHGQIELAANCQLQQRPGGAQVALDLRISDTGRGISKAQIDRLFAPFETGDNSFDSLPQSAGLGLSIVKRAVEAMGGDIEVHSTVGAGTEFRVSLQFELPEPAGSEMATPNNPGQDQRIDPKGFRFLVVDDNPINRQLMSKLLESEGCTSILADSGEAALELIGQHAVDAVLMDISMPGIDGLETTRRLLRRPELANLPVFGLTGFSDAVVRERAEISGMRHIYVKPLRRAQLQEVIGRILYAPAAPTGRKNQTRSRVALVKQDVARQIARISGDNWSVFVHQLNKECLALLARIRDALTAGATEDIQSAARRAGTTANTVGAAVLHQLFLEIEELAQQEKPAELADLIQRTEETLEETRLALGLL